MLRCDDLGPLSAKNFNKYIIQKMEIVWYKLLAYLYWDCWINAYITLLTLIREPLWEDGLSGNFNALEVCKAWDGWWSNRCESFMRLDILISYSYSESKDKDLYVTGDLYENDVVTPAMIVVPRRRVCFYIVFYLFFMILFLHEGMFYVPLNPSSFSLFLIHLK